MHCFVFIYVGAAAVFIWFPLFLADWNLLMFWKWPIRSYIVRMYSCICMFGYVITVVVIVFCLFFVVVVLVVVFYMGWCMYIDLYMCMNTNVHVCLYISAYQGFPTRMVYFHYISCLRYTILVRNPQYDAVVYNTLWQCTALWWYH